MTLSAPAARAAARGEPSPELAAHGLLLGGRAHGSRLPAHADFAREPEFLAHARALRCGRRAPNPLYAHLFAAFELAQQHPERGLPDLETQLGRWLPWADPLEQRPIVFGLTPYATALRLRVNVHEHLERSDLPVATDWSQVRLRADATLRHTVRARLQAATEIPARTRSDAELRELAVLLDTHDQLFLTLDPV